MRITTNRIIFYKTAFVMFTPKGTLAARMLSIAFDFSPTFKESSQYCSNYAHILLPAFATRESLPVSAMLYFTAFKHYLAFKA